MEKNNFIISFLASTDSISSKKKIINDIRCVNTINLKAVVMSEYNLKPVKKDYCDINNKKNTMKDLLFIAVNQKMMMMKFFLSYLYFFLNFL